MSSVLSFKLKKGFHNTIPYSGPDEKSHFVGRDEDLAKLVDIIKYRDSGSILLSGNRGIGKTSLIREAVRRARGEKITPVFLTLAEDPGEKKSTILRLMARGLYFEKAEEIKKHPEDPKLSLLDDLYTTCIFSEVEKSIFREDVSRRSIEKVDKVVRTLDLDKALLAFPTVTGFFVSALSYLSLAKSTEKLLVMAVPLILGLVVSAVLLCLFKKYNGLFTSVEKEVSRVDEKEKTEKGSSGILGKLDTSDDSLEFSLHKVLQMFGESEEKLVFVFDELDKLEQGSQQSTPAEAKVAAKDVVYRIVSKLKNLFTLNNALFFFITSDDTYYDILNEIEKNPYSNYHTLFSDKKFVEHHYYEDIDKIIENSVETEDLRRIKGDQGFLLFKNYITWKAKNHVFDTLSLLETFSDGDGVVTVKENADGLRGNIEEYWELGAYLQPYIDVIYDEHRRPYSSDYNDILLLALRAVSGGLFDSLSLVIEWPKANEEIPYLDLLVGFNEVLDKKERTLNSAEEKDIRGAIASFFSRMSSTGIVQKEDKIETRTEDEKGKPIEPLELNVTKFTVAKDWHKHFKPREELRDTTEPTDFEIKFLEAFAKYKGLKDKPLFSDYFSTYGEKFNRYGEIANRIRGTKPRYDRFQDEFEKRTIDVQNHLEKAKQHVSAALVEELVKGSQLVPATLAAVPPNNIPANQIDPDNSSFYSDAVSKKLEGPKFQIYTNQSGTRLLVIGFELTEEDLTNFKRNKNTKIVHITAMAPVARYKIKNFIVGAGYEKSDEVVSGLSRYKL